MCPTQKRRMINMDQSSSTEQLFKWITQVRTKKIEFLRSRRRNIRIEAVLGYALKHAEQELRNKQNARIHKWQELKRQMAELEKKKLKKHEVTEESLIQDGCQQADSVSELIGLSSFMAQLNATKVPESR